MEHSYSAAYLCYLIFKDSGFSSNLANVHSEHFSKIHLKLGIVNIQKQENRMTKQKLELKADVQ